MIISKPTLRRSGFTLVEVLVAGVILAFVMGSVSLSLSQLGKAKSSSKQRFDAYHRADVALTALRQNIVATIRSDDLFYTRLLLYDDSMNSDVGEVDRDEILIFTNQLREIYPSDYAGEGCEYETQFRIEDDEYGPVLWQRRDAVPEEFPLGGGLIKPVVEGVVSLSIEVYDGEQWQVSWDSDIDGLPYAVRITVMASGHRELDDLPTAPLATMRTVVALDRVLPPRDVIEDLLQEIAAETEGAEEGEMTEEELMQQLLDGGVVIPEGENALEMNFEIPDGTGELRPPGGPGVEIREGPGAGGSGGGSTGSGGVNSGSASGFGSGSSSSNKDPGDPGDRE